MAGIFATDELKRLASDYRVTEDDIRALIVSETDEDIKAPPKADPLSRVEIDQTKFFVPPVELHPATKDAIPYLENVETFYVGDIDGRRIEDNINTLSELVSDLRTLRDKYNQSAIDFIKVRDDISEYFALREIHRREIEAGIYELPWYELNEEHKGLLQSLERHKPTINNGNELSNLFAKEAVDNAVTNAGDAAGNSFDPEKFPAPRINSNVAATRYLANRRENIDRLSSYLHIPAVQSDVDTMTARHNAVHEKLIYARKDVEFKSLRTRVADDLAQRQLLELSVDGGPMNVKERLDNIRSNWEKTIQYAIAYARAVRFGLLKLEYDPDIDWPILRNGVITDNLQAWVDLVRRRMALKKQREYVTRFSKWFDRSTNSSEIQFEVRPEDVGRIDHCLRGLSLEFTGGLERPIQVEVFPPEGAYSWIGQNIASSAARSFQIGRVCKPTFANDSYRVLSEAFWNGSPVGKWRVVLRSKYSTADVSALCLHIWTAVRR
jgi:hypothetical protein